MLTTVAAGRVFDYSYCIGMFSMAAQGFQYPQDFTLDANGLMYVVSRGTEEIGMRISKVTMDHEFQGQFGTAGQSDGQFIWPRSIDVDKSGNVYVSDEYLNRISIFDAEGAFQSSWGSGGTGDGELKGPSGIAFDSADNLYVVDSENARVQKFSKDGRFLSTFGKFGSADGEFNMPWGLCTDKEDNVFVADFRNKRVQKFSPEGKFLAKFQGSSTGAGYLEAPSGVAVDSEGDVYVTDWSGHKVQIYAPDGLPIANLVGDAETPSPWTQTYIDANPDMQKARRRANMEPEWRFTRPVAVNVDDQDRIIILESHRHRFQIYNKEKNYEEHALTL